MYHQHGIHLQFNEFAPVSKDVSELSAKPKEGTWAAIEEIS
jgi:hypothetical protein